VSTVLGVLVVRMCTCGSLPTAAQACGRAGGACRCQVVALAQVNSAGALSACVMLVVVLAGWEVQSGELECQELDVCTVWRVWVEVVEGWELGV
jgi:hypothetical protein